MKRSFILFVVIAALVMAVMPAAAQSGAWQGYVLVDLNGLEILPVEVETALATVVTTNSSTASHNLQLRWSLNGGKLIAEGLWFTAPDEALIEVALATVYAGDVSGVQVSVFAPGGTYQQSALACRQYIYNPANIAEWESDE